MTRCLIWWFKLVLQQVSRNYMKHLKLRYALQLGGWDQSASGVGLILIPFCEHDGVFVGFFFLCVCVSCQTLTGQPKEEKSDLKDSNLDQNPHFLFCQLRLFKTFLGRIQIEDLTLFGKSNLIVILGFNVKLYWW